MTGEPDPTAAEFALGLLSGDELRDAQRRALTEQAFAAETARWRGRLGSLHEELAPVTPPRDLWSRIAAAISVPAAANDNIATLQRRLRAWRAGAGGMTAIAASLALVLLSEPRPSIVLPPPTAPRSAALPMVAMLGDERAMKVVASWDPNARQLVLAVAGDMPADPAHSHELWVIPANGKPRSLGTMPASKQMHMRLADALATLLQQGATIAISVEPPGGSKTGAPTGPVVASGALRNA